MFTKQESPGDYSQGTLPTSRLSTLKLRIKSVLIKLEGWLPFKPLCLALPNMSSCNPRTISPPKTAFVCFTERLINTARLQNCNAAQGLKEMP